MKLQRVAVLDCLRALAVVLVIVHHWGEVELDLVVGRAMARSGWIGVDLFFVLSGFLVSGLIFREYDRHGSFLARQFLVRRSLKIYPSFYVFILSSVILLPILGNERSGAEIARGALVEALFVQNYFGGLWTHTWSLAVEEHFYILLAVVAALAARHGQLRQPVRRVVLAIGCIAVVCLVLRLVTAQVVGYSWHNVYPRTHLRIDSLLIGVALAYAYHHRRERLVSLFDRYRAPLLLVGLLLVAPAWLLQRDDVLMYTLGLTSVAVGFGLITVALVSSSRAEALAGSMALRPVAWLGRYSYTTYLWHVAVMMMLDRTVITWFPGLSPWIALGLDLVLSFAVGVVTARLVEIPVLALRDRRVPSRSGVLEASPAATSPS